MTMRILYSPQEKASIIQRLRFLQQHNPNVSFLELQMMEVVARYMGSNGLSEESAQHLVACLMDVIDDAIQPVIS
jgi:hypothetical protein